MSVKGVYNLIIFLLVFVMPTVVCAQSAEDLLKQGNDLYNQGSFNQAVEKYERALVESPEAVEPKYNKANSFYRMDDLDAAMQLYREVASQAKDMKLVTNSKYNLGNCYFNQGIKQKDSDLQKALEDLQESIAQWRQVLDIEPENQKAARNIEVARLTIKDIIDQINKQQQEQSQDPNQQGQNQQQQNQQNQQGRQQQNNGSEDEQDQQQSGSEEENQNQQDQQNAQQQQAQQGDETENQQQVAAIDTTAQEILDNEQDQKRERQMLRASGHQPVDKDW